MDWTNWYEIINHYEALANEIPSREYLPKPKKLDNESNASFGKRLDDYDDAIKEKNIQNKVNSGLRLEIYQKLEMEIFKYFKVEWDDKKASKAWSIAWEHGHSSGYNDVVSYFEELVELIK